MVWPCFFLMKDVIGSLGNAVEYPEIEPIAEIPEEPVQYLSEKSDQKTFFSSLGRSYSVILTGAVGGVKENVRTYPGFLKVEILVVSHTQNPYRTYWLVFGEFMANLVPARGEKHLRVL
jgi:hypothetical protein